MQLLLKILLFPFLVIGKILAAIFGKVNWSMPPWLTYTTDMGKKSPIKLVALLMLVVGVGVLCFKAVDYYKHLPEPILVDAIITIPTVNNEYYVRDNVRDNVGDNVAGNASDNNSDNKSDLPPLTIAFSYTQNEPAPYTPMPIEDDEPSPRDFQTSMPVQLPSVAPINLIGAKVNKGINLSPNKAGTWTWKDDRTLSFAPETPWPAGQEYEVSFSADVFDTQDKFTDSEYSFTTESLAGEFETSNFELSLEDKVKQVFVQMRFNYPVDEKSVAQALQMAYQEEGSKVGSAQKYTLSFSENLLSASAILPIPTLPSEPQIIEVTLAEGVKSVYGGEPTASALNSKVVVPDLYSYLKVEQSSIEILRDPQNEPEQFILLSFTDAIERDELLSKFSLYLLPDTVASKNTARRGNRNNDNAGESNKYWRSPREVTVDVLQNAQKIDFVLMPNPKDSSKNYQIKVDIAPTRQLYFKIDSGLESSNGFIQRAFFDQIFNAPQYPQEVVISGEGSVLTHSEDQRLAFSTRGLQDVQVSIGKVIDDELYHLVSQTQGDISNPSFSNWRFNETNLAEFTTQYISMNAGSSNLKSAHYASVNLKQLMANAKGGLGLFFVEIKGWDKNNDREIYNVSDKLLVLVTDLGVIVKSSQDQSQDVFVQSIESGAPAAGALVELLAKNGTVLFSKTTGDKGHVAFPPANGFENEKQAVVYVISHENDVSFIPFDRYTRQINYSRFDVGGEYTYGDETDRVNAYMFTDRGIYRPGESVNIGMIVKGKNLQNVGTIPLELVVRDAQYNEVLVETISLPKYGFTDAIFNTQKSFKTGSYTASLHLMGSNNSADPKRLTRYRDRQIGSLNFDLEEFQADTMSITSQIKDLPNKGWSTSAKLINEVKLSNLFGVPAQDRRISSTLSVRPTQFAFDEFKELSFYSPKQDADSFGGLQSINETLADKTTNADGKANIEIDLARFTKGTYNLNVQTEGFEASGGRSVSTNVRFLYSPSQYLIGHKVDGKLDFINVDSQRTVSFLAIDNTLSPIALNKLSKRLSKVQSVSTLVKQYNGRYQYESIQKHQIMTQEAYAQPNGFAEHAVDTSQPGTFLIEILTSDSEVIASVEYTVVGASNDNAQLDKNAELKVVLDKGDYQPGDTIELSIVAPYAGSGLISIESDKLHSFKWFTSATKSSVQSIVIPQGIEGNAYINVAFVRNLASKEIFTSPLSYAVVPFSIDKTMRTLDISLRVDEIVQPGKPMAIGLNLSQNARVAVFAVDMGILQVANYRTPDPLAYFFKKRALNVRTMQILDLILPDFALTQMLSAAGGDMEGAANDSYELMARASKVARSANPFERKVQEPAVYWSGVVNGNKGDNTYTFNVPNDFAGALRVMAIAVGETTIGRAQENTIVRGPFVLSPNVLNQAAPADEFEVTLNVANVVKKSPQNAEVNISVSASEHLSIVGSNTAQMLLSENQEEAVRFAIKAKDILGGASLNFTVNMTDATGKTWQSFRTATLSIRPAMPFEVSVATGAASSGKVSLKTPIQLYAQQSTQLLKASVSPLVIGEGLSAYLDEYPHSCTEQVVSQVFPLIGLSTLAQYAPHSEKVSAKFNELISKLSQRQSYEGGFSYWPGMQENDVDTSIYVMHFLIEAQSLGYAVPQDMLQSGVRYLNDTANTYVRNNSQSKASIRSLRQRAKLLYLLTRSGVVTSNLVIDLLNTLDKQHKNEWREDIVSAYISASYSLLQQNEQANKLIGQYDMNQGSLLIDQAFAGIAPRLALDAQYLFLVAKHFPAQLEKVSAKALLNITQSIYKGEYNTVSAAYSMLALGAYQGAVGEQLGDASVAEIDQQISFIAFTLQAQTPLEASYTPFASAPYAVNTQKVEANIAASALPKGGALYYANMQAGYKTQVPTQALIEGLEIQKAFINKDGEIATNIKQGDEIKVRLRVRASEQKNIANIAIVDLLPGGFEVIRESVPRRAGAWQSNYIDIREDRIIFYGDVTNRVTEISYSVKVTAAGTFVVPPSFAEAMYDRSIKAYSSASTLTVEGSD